MNAFRKNVPTHVVDLRTGESQRRSQMIAPRSRDEVHARRRAH